MRQLAWISTASIRMDRFPLNPTVLKLCLHLAKKGTVPPIHVQYIKADGEYWILDGRHRVTAHKLMGRRKILARFYKEVKKHDEVKRSNPTG